MLKHLWICAALVSLGMGPVYAQKQEAVLRHIEVAGTDFNLVLAEPKPGGNVLPDLGNTPDALIVHLHGGTLALVFEDAKQMMEVLDLLRSPSTWIRAAADRFTQWPCTSCRSPWGFLRALKEWPWKSSTASAGRRC